VPRHAQSADRASTQKSLCRRVCSAGQGHIHHLGLLSVPRVADHVVDSTRTNLTSRTTVVLHNGWQVQTRAHAPIATLVVSPVAIEVTASTACQGQRVKTASNASCATILGSTVTNQASATARRRRACPVGQGTGLMRMHQSVCHVPLVHLHHAQLLAVAYVRFP
jgi:hypothetical protein